MYLTQKSIPNITQLNEKSKAKLLAEDIGNIFMTFD
jgi:hypothetical protein